MLSDSKVQQIIVKTDFLNMLFDDIGLFGMIKNGNFV